MPNATVFTSRTIACSCSVSGRARRRARAPAIRPRRATLALLGSAISPFVLNFQDFLARPEERLDHARVEMPAGLGTHVAECFLARPCLLVRSHRAERVVHVRHRDDAR